MLQIMKVQFIKKNSYLFRKGEKGEFAYLILHGQVSFLTLNMHNWHGQTPRDKKIKEDLETCQYMRYLENGEDGLYSVETETVIVTFEKNRLFGEIALLDSTKATRMLSALTKTDCILLLLN